VGQLAADALALTFFPSRTSKSLGPLDDADSTPMPTPSLLEEAPNWQSVVMFAFRNLPMHLKCTT
jgi:hypothetical protein